jgi:hypothetical protein
LPAWIDAHGRPPDWVASFFLTRSPEGALENYLFNMNIALAEIRMTSSALRG